MPNNRVHKYLFRRGLSGFSLVELAIAIFVITLLLGSILVPLSTQWSSEKTAKPRRHWRTSGRR